MERPRRVPVIVLAGFLGSGKTTLLNYLLRNSGGTRIGAIVNDFGSIEIDAMTVAGQVDSMVPLGDGCLCCAVDTSDMDGVLERLARPSAGMDVIIVEASGLAEPETVIRMILASGSRHSVYGGLVEVVDGAEFETVRVRHPELDRHVRAADLVVLNKSDRVGETELRRLRETLEETAPGIPVVPAEHGRIDPALLFDPVHRPRPPVEQLSFDALLRDEAEDAGGGADEDHTGHLHAAYESVEFTSATALDPRRFLAFLDSRPPGLYRIKGFVDFGAADPVNSYSVHAVGGFLRFAPSRRKTGEAGETGETGEAAPTQLVMIGAGTDGDALRKELAACVADASVPPDPQAMWGVLRYVEDDGTDEYAAHVEDDEHGAAEEAGEPVADGAADGLHYGNGPRVPAEGQDFTFDPGTDY
ncbi:GTP-binding protein [Streptomyces sp. WMMB 322]|uniref:CobW family GTP-binding protein n=1 Tax=Streptomyces sp. WMMB 322 TaxID=1286821 RepID=UPI000823EE8D|nr:CobW family GTP-binding protein [Streptomyces sp. WMMB 322]SCK50112.1 GTPase, G3E family [Streptomyces sp. WMMB 322]